MNKVSVIIPAFNAERYIEEALGSVLNQSYDNLEIIICDDGSSDGTGEKIQGLCEKNPQIIYLRNTENLGVSSARNRALERATGDFIAFLDADDRWKSTKIAEQVDYLKKRPDIGFLITNFSIINDGGEIVDSTYIKDVVIPTGKVPLKTFIIDRYPLATPSVMVRAQCLSNAGGFNPTYEIGEDFDLWIRILRSTKQGYIPRPLVEVRLHNDNSTRIQIKNRLNKVLILEQLMKQDNTLMEELGSDFRKYLFRQYLRLAKIYKRLGHREECDTYYRKALELDTSLPMKFKAFVLQRRYH